MWWDYLPGHLPGVATPVRTCAANGLIIRQSTKKPICFATNVLLSKSVNNFTHRSPCGKVRRKNRLAPFSAHDVFIGSLYCDLFCDWLQRYTTSQQQIESQTTNYSDLLWICCGLGVQFSICCKLVVDFVVAYSLLYIKSTTNQTNGV